jgi:hypothetical protein
MGWFGDDSSGLGMFPFLQNLFGSSSTPAVSGAPAINPTIPNWSPQTDAPTAAMLEQAGKLFPGAPPSQLPDYIRANPEMFRPGGNPYNAPDAQANQKSLSDRLGALGTALDKSPIAQAGALGKPPQTTFPPAPPPLQQPGGVGPNVGGFLPLAQMMMSMKMPTGGIGPPLGPAASNPLLAMLKSRLGIQ